MTDLARAFTLVLVFACLGPWLFRMGKAYGAAEAAACSAHCDGVHGGRGILDARADRCTCADGEPAITASFDRGDGRRPGDPVEGRP